MDSSHPLPPATLVCMPATTTRKRTPTRRSVASTATVIDADDVEIIDAPVEFTVPFQRDGDDTGEKHTFKARPELTYKRMKDVATAQRTGGVNAILLFERMIRPALVDTDGTPAKWEPEFEGGKLIGPDGDLYPTSDLPTFQEFTAGSSKRRWLYLMDEDDDVEVDIDDIAAVYETLVEACSGRPTRKS